MNLPELTDRMARFPQALAAAAAMFSDADLSWLPEDGGWSVIEIVGHVLIEEVEDFRRRTLMTLQQPGVPWPGIDPEARVREMDFSSARISDLLQQFHAAGAESLRLLGSLDAPDWKAEYHHPSLGVFRAGDLLAAWVAHDALHLRQIAKRQYQLACRDTRPFDARYAGDWKA